MPGRSVCAPTAAAFILVQTSSRKDLPMEPRKDGQKNDEQLRREEKQRPRFRPILERLEERISPSISIFGFNHGGHYIGHKGGHGYPA
jgi:hypothetical protein